MYVCTYEHKQLCNIEVTVDWEYFVGTKLAWVKCSMSFNFVELHEYEIILTWKF